MMTCEQVYMRTAGFGVRQGVGADLDDPAHDRQPGRRTPDLLSGREPGDEERVGDRVEGEREGGQDDAGGRVVDFRAVLEVPWLAEGGYVEERRDGGLSKPLCQPAPVKGVLWEE